MIQDLAALSIAFVALGLAWTPRDWSWVLVGLAMAMTALALALA
jgi:hypothetical protein